MTKYVCPFFNCAQIVDTHQVCAVQPFCPSVARKLTPQNYCRTATDTITWQSTKPSKVAVGKACAATGLQSAWCCQDRRIHLPPLGSPFRNFGERKQGAKPRGNLRQNLSGSCCQTLYCVRDAVSVNHTVKDVNNHKLPKLLDA